MGGEKARHTLLALDAALDSTILAPNNTRLPKISDMRFSHHGKRRAASIPPKTAATSTVTALLSQTNNAVLQSLVNNNTFLGRGTYNSNRNNSITTSPSNQREPMSPPSIQVQGTRNVL